MKPHQQSPPLSSSASASANTTTSTSTLTSSRAGLLPSASSSASPLVSSTTPPASEDPSPTDLLLATPPSLLKLFALCAPFVSSATTLCQLVTWQHDNFFASLLVLLAWWCVCLFGRALAKYGFNAAVLVYILARYFSTASRHASSPDAAAAAAAFSSSSPYRHARPPTLTPAAYAQLVQSSHFLFSHLHQFRTSVVHPVSQRFSFTPTRPSHPAPAYATARLAVTSYPLYLIVTYLVPVRYLFLVAGSVAILWRAPFFRTLRVVLWQSAAIRWAVRIFVSIGLNGARGFSTEWSRTSSGIGVAGLVGKKKYAPGGAGPGARGARAANDGAIVVEEKVVKTLKIKKPVDSTEYGTTFDPVRDAGSTKTVEEEESEEDVQVQFTTFENQRWWVGLDWTHALLPGERASWTDPSSNPSNPPASFNLPPAQVTYFASPTATDPLSRLKKTTSWRWLDPEWQVLRESVPSVALPVSPALGSAMATATATTTSGDSPPSPTQAPSASSSIFSSLPSPPANLLHSSASASPVTPTAFSSPSALIADAHSRMFEHWHVDAEGWQYGDNHFEKMGPKGGLGKYTRRRAWVRRAGLVETTERVSGGGGPVGPSSSSSSLGSSTLVGGGDRDERAVARARRLEGDKTRRKSDSRHDTGSMGAKAAGGGPSSGSAASSIRKRKSMPPTLGSEISISKDVD